MKVIFLIIFSFFISVTYSQKFDYCKNGEKNYRIIIEDSSGKEITGFSVYPSLKPIIIDSFIYVSKITYNSELNRGYGFEIAKYRIYNYTFKRIKTYFFDLDYTENCFPEAKFSSSFKIHISKRKIKISYGLKHNRKKYVFNFSNEGLENFGKKICENLIKYHSSEICKCKNSD